MKWSLHNFGKRLSKRTNELLFVAEFKIPRGWENVPAEKIKEQLMAQLATDWAVVKAALANKDQQISTLTAEVPDAADVSAIADIHATAAALNPPAAPPAAPAA